MVKIDFKKELRHLYKASKTRIGTVTVPAMNYLMITGQGDPATDASFTKAIEALFGLSYTLKFMVRDEDPAIDYGVLPLEGLWWVDDPPLRLSKRGDWRWTLMVMQPEFVGPDKVEEASARLESGKNPPMLSEITFESFEEGKTVQTLHVGPYFEEGPTIKRVHDFIALQGRALRGRHHEIYLSDPRRADSANWKTIIRQPMT